MSTSEAPQTNGHNTSDASELPSEALNLAAKIFDFARSGDTTSLSQYLTAGIPPNLTNHEGNTLLMLAAYNGHLETVTLLLEKKADANVLNGRGQSPIAGAVFKGYDEIVKLLVDAGADVRLGQPSAVDAARMFRREDALRIMGVDQEKIT
jgi:ankyrin repeat protein